MGTATIEIKSIIFLLRDVSVTFHRPPYLFHKNINAIHITINPILYGHIKHIKIGYRFIHEKVGIDHLITKYIPLHIHIVIIPNKTTIWKPIQLIPIQALGALYTTHKLEEAWSDKRHDRHNQAHNQEAYCHSTNKNKKKDQREVTPYRKFYQRGKKIPIIMQNEQLVI